MAKFLLDRAALWIALGVAVFAIFPLTDTDIWWHLACAREWVTTWTPVREPVVNVHDFFQKVVALIYDIGGASLLVYFKAVLWGIVFVLFLNPRRENVGLASRPYVSLRVAFALALLFIFRYQLEIRPVVFSLLFLGVYWNVLPVLFRREDSCGTSSEGVGPVPPAGRWTSGLVRKFPVGKFVGCMALLLVQWVWCKCQGLYILGPLFASGVFLVELCKAGEARKKLLPWGILPLAMFGMPFLHGEGLSLLLYPLGLLDRLLGLTPSASVFASQIAENRSPVTLLLSGENVLVSFGMVALAVLSIGYEVMRVIDLRRRTRRDVRRNTARETDLRDVTLGAASRDSARDTVLHVSLLGTAFLALVAGRNFVLFLPVFMSLWIGPWACSRVIPASEPESDIPAADQPRGLAAARTCKKSGGHISAIKSLGLISLIAVFFLLGLWLRSLQAYDRTMVSYQRVPVAAAEWMKSHPHEGRLFNDDRAGGYLAFVNPQDSTYIDGRFILKTADFFERYLQYAISPDVFLKDAQEQNIDRVILPIRYYARWEKLINALSQTYLDRTAHGFESRVGQGAWLPVYKDDDYVIFDYDVFSMDSNPFRWDKRRYFTHDFAF